MLTLAAGVLLPALAHAQAIEAWVQRYNGPGNGNDFVHAMAVDTRGNVYVAGDSDGGYPTADDWATIAYSGAGVPLWTNRYNGPANSFDGARAVALDSDGNVLVTGYSTDVSGGSAGQHCTTIKYSTAGVSLWTNVHSLAATGGKAVAVDVSGNVFVTGALYRPGSSGDNLTIKYSSAGVMLWAKMYSDGGSVVGVAADAKGDVIVAASCAGTFGRDYLTLKYSSSGTLLWARRYTGPPDHDDPIQALAVDANGAAYVTGSSDGGGGDWDYATIKYSSGGVPLWTNRYDGPGDSKSDSSRAIVVDPSGNVIVTGYASSSRYATIKYLSAGLPLWTNLHVAGDAYALTTDSSGNIYVTGVSDGGPNVSDFLTVAYSSSGMPLWTNRHNGPANGGDEAKMIAVDANGSVYVAGCVRDTNFINSDFATVKYVVPPIITRHPLSCTNAVGTTDSFTVQVAGSAPFGFQWRKNGTDLTDGGKLSGATTTNLQIANVQLADAGGYSVVVTNAYGSTTSSVAQLNVYIPPNPGRFTKLSYSGETGFSFIFRDGTVGRPYRIQVSSSLTGGWLDWQSFNYLGPVGFTDLGTLESTNRFYRAVSP